MLRLLAKTKTAAEIVDTSKTGGNSKADFFFPDFGDKQEKRQYAQAWAKDMVLEVQIKDMPADSSIVRTEDRKEEQSAT